MQPDPATSPSVAIRDYFAPCPRGLEALLVAELQALGASDARGAPGGAAFRGDMALCWRANLCSRLASRILLQLAHAPYRTDQNVYDAAFAIDWPALFALENSIRVDVNAIRSPLKSLDFVTLRIKDAVCDRFRKQCHARPNVDTREPDVRIQGFLDATHVTLYVDTSGDALYKRGYRSDVGEAPLKENLAAGIVILTGWDRKTPLFDPMCGSGTLVIEAALMALDLPPGARREFGFQKFLGHDAEAWQALRSEIIAHASKPRPLEIFASDISGRELRRTRDNLAAAGLTNVVVCGEADVLEVPAPATEGVLVTNPPYGVRIGVPGTRAHNALVEPAQQRQTRLASSGNRDAQSVSSEATSDLAAFYPKLGDALKARFAGWNCYIFSGDPQFAKLIRLKATKRTPLFNGPLECRLYEYRMVAGSARKPASAEISDAGNHTGEQA